MFEDLELRLVAAADGGRLAHLSRPSPDDPTTAMEPLARPNLFERASEAAHGLIHDAVGALGLEPDETGLLKIDPDTRLAIAVWVAHQASGRTPSPLRWATAAAPGTPRRGVPRVDWAGVTASIFFPPGIGIRWHERMTRYGLLRYARCMSFGLPADIAKAALKDRVLVDVLGPMLGLDFARVDVATCPTPPFPGWQDELRLPITRGYDPAYLAGDWLVERLLNGFSPCPLVAIGPDRYEARLSFRDLVFGGAKAAAYLQPDVAVQIAVVDHAPTLAAIRVAYRAADGTYEAPVVVTPADPLWRRLRAARIAASAYFLSGQFDQHIARGHVIPEMMSVVIDGLSADHPVRRVLGPRVTEIAGVNLAADGGIWGPQGVLVQCSALEADAVAKRIADRVAAFDWSTYQPPSKAIAAAHYAPPALRSYWDDVLVPYVTDALAALPWTSAHHDEIETLSTACRGVPLTRRAWDGGFAGDPPDPVTPAWFDDAEFRSTRAPGTPGWAPIPDTRAGDLSGVIQFCVFGIFHSTLAHTWANVRQTTDAGDPGYAMIALAARVDDPAPADPSDDRAWHARANPPPCDEAYQRAVGQILSNVPVDTMDDEYTGFPSADIPHDPMTGDASLATRTRRWIDEVVWRLPHPDPFVTTLVNHLSRANR